MKETLQRLNTLTPIDLDNAIRLTYLSSESSRQAHSLILFSAGWEISAVDR